jgi:ribose transport system ATP-binding protein
MTDSSGDNLGVAMRMVGVSKQFPGTLAVDNVDFDVRAGEVHALMGENGAGKSTLMKILAGTFDNYTGKISISTKEVDLHSPAKAKEYGIGMIYQELSLARPLSIAENLLVGRLPKKGIFLDKKAMLKEASICLKRVGLDIDPRITVEEISQHEAQLVEIAKVLGNHPCIMVLDEPTSALSRKEVERLFDIIDKLKKSGLAIIYISHHLPEIFRVADRVTVMRDGKKIDTKDIADVTPSTLVQMMVGKSIKEFYTKRDAKIGTEMIKVDHLSRYGFFHDISFSAYRGEILGIAGLSGAGRTELARSMCGIDPIDEGYVKIDGDYIPPNSCPAAIKNGLFYLSENRKDDGLFLRLSITQNIVSALIPDNTTFGIYSGLNDKEIAENMISKLEIATSSAGADVGNLSGGNQQKVMLGKWVAAKPKVLILDEPSRGVDVGAKMKIHEAVMEIANQGNTVILISSDLPELVGLSDRVLVMREGHFIGEMQKNELSEESVLLAANGDLEKGEIGNE